MCLFNRLVVEFTHKDFVCPCVLCLLFHSYVKPRSNFFSGKGRCVFEKNLPFTYQGLPIMFPGQVGYFIVWWGLPFFITRSQFLPTKIRIPAQRWGNVFSFHLHVMGIRCFPFSFLSCQLKRTLVSKTSETMGVGSFSFATATNLHNSGE